MTRVAAALRALRGHKKKVAVIFSLGALMAPFGKSAIEMLVPNDQLIVVASDFSTGASERTLFNVTKDKGKLRLDPRVHMSFMNNSQNQILIKSVDLTSPLDGGERKSKDRCESEKNFNMWMYKFESSDTETKPAAPFAIGAGQIVTMWISFAGIPDIEKDVDIKKGIPICIHTVVFDIKGRRHEFKVHAFDITEANEKWTTYTSLLENKSIAVLRFSQLWSMLH